MIVKKNPTPLNLFNLYGDDGDKYVIGGIFIRRVKGWTVCNQNFEDMPLMSTEKDENAQIQTSTTESLHKIASLDVRNLSLLRGRIENLVVPLACVVDYYGNRFETQSLLPISINSIAYGSDTDGLVFHDYDAFAIKMAC